MVSNNLYTVVIGKKRLYGVEYDVIKRIFIRGDTNTQQVSYCIYKTVVNEGEYLWSAFSKGNHIAEGKIKILLSSSGNGTAWTRSFLDLEEKKMTPKMIEYEIQQSI